MTTVKAALGGWVPLVNFHNGTLVPLCFVLKLSDKFSPTYITDSFRQTVVLDHIFDVQTLDAYDLVFAYDLGREFMLIVSSPVGNLLMNAGNLETRFVTVLRPFFLFCVTALCFRQFLFIFGEELGVTMRLSIRGDDQRLQTQVKSNHLRGHFPCFDVFFSQYGDKIVFGFIFGDGDTAWFTPLGQGAMPNNGKRGIHLGKSESLSLPGKRIACIGSGLLVPLLFEGGIVSTPFKEVARGSIEMSESLLERDRRNLIEPHRRFLLFEQDQPLRGVLVVQALTMLVVGVSALPQCPIVDVAATSE